MNRVDDPVFALVAFYDLLDYPLTGVELWRLAQAWGETASLRETIEAAEAHPRLMCIDGFFCLQKREHLIPQRKARYAETEIQLKQAWKWLTFIAMMPGIRAMFLCNTYGISNPSPTSDIDLFIITDSNRIWTARLWSTTLMRLVKRRPKEGQEQGSICLSFYSNSPAVNIAELAEGIDDIYLDFWKQWLIPIYDPQQLRADISRVNASIERPLIRRRRIKHHPIIKWTLARLPLESLARTIQWRIFPETIHSQANLTSHVIVTNNMLKFHTHDGRNTYQNAWHSRIQGV